MPFPPQVEGLEHLDVRCTCEENTALGLSGLPSLRSCALQVDCGWEPTDVTITVRSLSCQDSLTSLRFVGGGAAVLRFAPGALDGLGSLHTVDLISCSLTRVPAALEVLSPTLEYLRMDHNQGLQLHDSSINVLCRLSKLKVIGVIKRHLGDEHPHASSELQELLGFVPALWDIQSVVNIGQFSSRWEAVHSVRWLAPVPKLELHGYQSESGSEEGPEEGAPGAEHA